MERLTNAAARAIGIFIFFSLLSNVALVKSQATAEGRRRLAASAHRNLQIMKIVSEIDARNIERTIRKLVSFGTRNTLSEQDNPNRGIGAARDWLYAEFQKVAEESGGRMTVQKQTFEQARAPRVPQPTMLTNIVATLKGTQPESENRVYVVSDITIRCVPVQLMQNATRRAPTTTHPAPQQCSRWLA